jgi:hypothetical protein
VAPSAIHLTWTMRHVSTRIADSNFAALNWIIAACMIKQTNAFLSMWQARGSLQKLAKQGFMALLICSCLPQPRRIWKWKTQTKRTRSQQSVLHLHASLSLFISFPILSHVTHALSQWKLLHSNTFRSSLQQRYNTQHQKLLHH